MSANICRDTVTSAIWNVMKRAWLVTFAPILISFSRRLVSDHGSAALGHRQRAHEVARVVGQRMEREADGVGGEGAARQPGPFDRALAVLNGTASPWGAAASPEGRW
jgi:hypothetical protein